MTSDYDSDHRQFGYGRELTLEDQQRGFVPHQRHIFLCYGTRSSWPADFVIDGPDSLPARLISALKSGEDQIKRKTIVTICEPTGDELLEEGDVLIFPDMIKYRLTPSGVDSFIQEVLVRDGIWSGSKMKPLRKGYYVFVCAHGAHDRRSGVCGELVLQKLNQLVEVNKLQEKLFPVPCSDIGAPEHAANFIIFGRDADQQVDGHWYTFVCPDDIPCFIFSHIVQGFVHPDRWRGKLGNKTILPLDEYPQAIWWRACIEDFLCIHPYQYGDLKVGWDALKEEGELEKAMEQFIEDVIPFKWVMQDPPAGIVEGAEPWLKLKGELNIVWGVPEMQNVEGEPGECAPEMQWEQNVERPSTEEPEPEREPGECASEMQRAQNVERPRTWSVCPINCRRSKGVPEMQNVEGEAGECASEMQWEQNVERPRSVWPINCRRSKRSVRGVNELRTRYD